MIRQLGIVAIWAVGTFTVIAVGTLVSVWAERKIAGHIQSRLGPFHTGWHGSIQTLADTLKLLTKEDVIPSRVDRFLYLGAPFVVFIPAALAYLVFPVDGTTAARDLPVGALYVLAVPGIAVLGFLMAGWGSHNNYSLMGGLRAAAQMLAYEVPRSLAVLSVVVLTGTMSLSRIVAAQSTYVFGPWFAILLPLGFVLFLVTSIAEVNRTPFDIPEAESELVGGFHTEYSGIRWSLFMMAEYANAIAASILASVLFLGGATGPVLPGPIWLLIKTAALVAFMMWMRWTLPRFRSDQLMRLSWKFFTPLAIANVAWAALLALLLPRTVVP